MDEDLVSPHELMVASLLDVVSVDSNEVFRPYTNEIIFVLLLDSPTGKQQTTIPTPRLPRHVHRINLGLIHVKDFADKTTNGVPVIFLFHIFGSFTIKMHNFHE